MKIKLLKIRYENIRDFNELTLDLTKENSEDEPHKISLVQMPNGTGKTTTIGLLRKLFYGHEFQPDEIMEYQNKKSPQHTQDLNIQEFITQNQFYNTEQKKHDLEKHLSSEKHQFI